LQTAGIIGGIGPESTIEYYRFIIASYRERTGGGSYPPIIINSIDLDRGIALLTANNLPELVDYISSELLKLCNAGADFAVLAANSPHLVFDGLRAESPIPLISIVEATCRAVAAAGLKRVGLLGTRFTMQARFYPDVFARAGLTVVVPSPEEQDYIHEKYLGELLKNVFLPETRKNLLAIIEAVKARERIEGLILGGTELPLILRDAPQVGIPFFDTTKIHVEEIVDRILDEDHSVS
jgi:aspartate racemase